MELNKQYWNKLVFMVLFFIGLKASISFASGAASSNWSVNKQQIMLSTNSGTPATFFAKGIIYEPIPIGFSDGSTFVDVYHKEWRALYKRDIPILRAMGVNNIRVYGFFGYPPTYGQDKSLSKEKNIFNTLKENYKNCINSTTGEPLSDQSQCVSYWDKAPWDHREFLDELWNDGVDPIYLLAGIDNESIGLFFPKGTKKGGNTQPTTGTVGYLGYKNYQNFYTNLIAWLGRKYGDHPALLGFALFNEKNDGRWDNPTFWNLINGYANQIHGDENFNGKLVGLALQTSAADVKKYMSNTYVLKSSVDFWGVNLYPVSNYGDKYATYVKQNPNKAKPLMVTEYGALSVTHDPDVAGWPGCGSSCPVGNETATNEKNASKEIIKNYQAVNNASYSFFNGFYYFEYSDEWWKMKKPGTGKAITDENTEHLWIHDLGNASGGGDSASGYWDEEWWGVLAAQRTGYDVQSFQRNSYKNNHTAWIDGAQYYKTPLDYLIPRDQLLTLTQLYTNDKNKTLSDVPTQWTLTLSNMTPATTVAALYAYESQPQPNQVYQATYKVGPGQKAAMALPANTQSLIIYNAEQDSWIPICKNIASKLANNNGATLYVSKSSSTYVCGFTKPTPPKYSCSNLTTQYPVYCQAIPGKDYGPALTWGCGAGGVNCGIIASGGLYSSCSGAEKFTWMASRYYHLQASPTASDCSFGGVGALATQ
ncbi:hypothetical protein [Aliikangiella sp. IMCC44359]|uniref:hypothetical protein n=1 Tax=Aliikangiella sp. IMCC44359 TaxID=3459125 RepID=UPI00403AEBB8